MTRPQGWLAFILSLAIAAGALLATWNTPTDPLGQKLGLDLRGGSQLTLQVLPAGEIRTIQPEQLEAVREVLERRINGLGVAESTLQTVGNDQLVLQLPGEQNPSQAAKVLGTTALLEFRSQRPGTEKEMQDLLPLKRQVEAVIAARRPAAPPPVIPAVRNSGPTVASLMERPSRTIPRTRPVPAIDWVRRANCSPPSRVKLRVTSQPLPLWRCWRPALCSSLPVNKVGP